MTDLTAEQSEADDLDAENALIATSTSTALVEDRRSATGDATSTHSADRCPPSRAAAFAAAFPVAGAADVASRDTGS